MLKSFIKRLNNLISLVPLSLIAVYRLFSKYTMPRCRFYPTCSQYAIDSIRKHGPFYGLLKAVIRIFRCNPLSEGGYDPVK